MKIRDRKIELQKSDQNDLHIALNKAEQELFDLRLNLRAGQIKNYARVKILKRDIARIRTMLHIKNFDALENA